MKLLVIVTLAIGAAFAQPPNPKTEILKMEDAWISAIKARDAAALDRLLADDIVYTHATGPVDTKSQYIASITSGNQKYASVERNDMNLRVFGDAAVVTANMRMMGATKGKPFDDRVRMIHVWIKQKGAWQLVAHQTTRIP